MRMGSFATRMLVLLFLSALMAACGGGGSAAPAVSNAAATGIFTKATQTVSAGWSGFLDPSAGAYQHWQNLYRAADIKGSGKITGLAYKYDIALNNTVTCPNTTIKLGHTMLSVITTTFASNVSNGKGSQVTVLSNGTLTFPQGSSNTWHAITFAEPFDYNGVDNLVVEFIKSAACTGTVTEGVAFTAGSYNATVWSLTSASTGTVAAYIQNAKFIFSGGDDLVTYGAQSPFSGPFSGIGINRRVQALHTAASISGSGPITGVGMVVGALTSESTYTVTIKLGHTLLTQPSKTFANNFSDTPVTVANGVVFTIPASMSTGSILWLPFTGSFNYNGADNLIVDIDVTGGSLNENSWASTPTPNGSLRGTTGSSTGLGSASSLHTKFRFSGSTMDVIGADDSGTSIFNTVATGRQFLLRGADLGTAGAITKIACRAAVSSAAAASYSNFIVTLATTTRIALVADDATNIAGGTVVSSGTFTIPAGISMGDWVEMPLSTPFSYNGSDNLVVQIAQGGGTSVQGCYITGPAVRYTDSTKSTGGVALVAYRGSFRFWMNK